MTEIGSSEFPFRLETFLKHKADIDVRALVTADLGEFTPHDFLYEFYSRTTQDIACLKGKLRRIHSSNPRTPGGILMLRKECKDTKSRISKLEKEVMDLQKRKRSWEEAQHLELSRVVSYKSSDKTHHPTEQHRGITLPAIQKDTPNPKVRPPSTRPTKKKLMFPPIN